MRDAWDLSRETQKQVRKKAPLLFLDYRANMQTPQTKLPQKETPSPQAHTPQRTMMDLPEAHAADSEEPVQHIPQHRGHELLSSLQPLPNE